MNHNNTEHEPFYKSFTTNVWVSIVEPGVDAGINGHVIPAGREEPSAVGTTIDDDEVHQRVLAVRQALVAASPGQEFVFTDQQVSEWVELTHRASDEKYEV